MNICILVAIFEWGNEHEYVNVIFCCSVGHGWSRRLQCNEGAVYEERGRIHARVLSDRPLQSRWNSPATQTDSQSQRCVSRSQPHSIIVTSSNTSSFFSIVEIKWSISEELIRYILAPKRLLRYDHKTIRHSMLTGCSVVLKSILIVLFSSLNHWVKLWNIIQCTLDLPALDYPPIRFGTSRITANSYTRLRNEIPHYYWRKVIDYPAKTDVVLGRTKAFFRRQIWVKEKC